jgi:hypothetical protein
MTAANGISDRMTGTALFISMPSQDVTRYQCAGSAKVSER